MGAEQRKPSPKDAVKPPEWTPPNLIETIGQYAFGLGHFSLDAVTAVYLKGVPTVVYLGQVGPDDNALNLIVLEQVRLNVDGVRSVNWRYGTSEGTSLKETLAIGSREKQKEATRFIAHRPFIIAGARLQGKIISDVRKFRAK